MKDVPYVNGSFLSADPDSQGVPSGAIRRFLQELERNEVDIHSLYIFRNGYQLVGANRKPYRADTPRRIYSAAKALTGLAVLFAIQEGLVAEDTRLTELFPEDLPDPVTERMQRMTVRHLLTMTTGHDSDTFRPILNGKNSVKAFLEEPLPFEPGTHFLYNNGVPHILGLIVKKVSGLDYLEFLRPRFLDPLGIYCTVEKTGRGELEGSRTVCTAEGFAKLALFYLQEGSWNGKQLLEAALIRRAGEKQVDSGRCSSISFMHTDQFAGYGYQVWRNWKEGFRLDGGRSQFGFIFPDKNLAVVCNAIEEDSGLIPELFWKNLYPAVTDRQAADEEAYAELSAYLKSWSCAPKLLPAPEYEDDYYGKWYEFQDNSWRFQALRIDRTEKGPAVTIRAGREYRIVCGLGGEWNENESFPPMPTERERLNQIFGVTSPRYLASGGWASPFCFVFQTRRTDWMDYYTFYCRFNGSRLSLCVESNTERLTHIRKRIPMNPREYSDAPVEGKYER